MQSCKAYVIELVVQGLDFVCLRTARKRLNGNFLFQNKIYPPSILTVLKFRLGMRGLKTYVELYSRNGNKESALCVAECESVTHDVVGRSGIRVY